MAWNSIIVPYNKINEIEESEPISPPNSDLFEEANEHHSFEIYPKKFDDYLIDKNLKEKRFTSPVQDLKYNLSNMPSNCIFDGNKKLKNKNDNIDSSPVYEEQAKINSTIPKENMAKKPMIFCKKFPVYKMKNNKNNNTTSKINTNSYSDSRNNINLINKNCSNNNNLTEKDHRYFMNKVNNNARILSRVKEDSQLDSFRNEELNVDNSLFNEFNNTTNYNVNVIEKLRKNYENNKNTSKNLYKDKNIITNQENEIHESKTIRMSSSGLMTNQNDFLGVMKNKKMSAINKLKKFPKIPINLNATNKKYNSSRVDESDYLHCNSEGVDENVDAKLPQINKEMNTKTKNDVVNLTKKNYIINNNIKNVLKLSQFRKIMKNNSFFNLLRFLDYYDLINLLQSSRQIRNMLNKSISDIYYFRIRENLKKYKSLIELLKCTLVYSNVKDTLKIDFVINIRFNNNKKFSSNNFFKPLFIQIAYIYNYFQKKKMKKELITKEEQQNYNKIIKMYDHYTFDLFWEGDISAHKTFLMEELSLFPKDNSDNIVYIQPVLPFKMNDRGIINLEIYTTNNNFIDPFSIKILAKSCELRNYINDLRLKEIHDPRISEYENVCGHWKNINSFPKFLNLKNEVEKLFQPCFKIKNFYFENIGVNIIKVILEAIQTGEIVNKKKLQVKIIVKDKNDYVENEIRKNNLLFERRAIFELRVGDEMTYYFSTKENK